MDFLLKEVMLNKIEFLQETNDVNFEFYDASSGKDIGKIICRNVYKLDISTSFLFDKEPFPCFVLNVDCRDFNRNEITEILKKLNYAFKDGDEPIVPEEDLFSIFRIQGGPIDISVISRIVEMIL